MATDKVMSSKSEEKTNNLKYLFSYISYQRLMYTLKRNLLLIKQIEVNTAYPTSDNGKLCKPENVVKLYDTIQQVSMIIIINIVIVIYIYIYIN